MLKPATGWIPLLIAGACPRRAGFRGVPGGGLAEVFSGARIPQHPISTATRLAAERWSLKTADLQESWNGFS